jgi:hypothetical protein
MRPFRTFLLACLLLGLTAAPADAHGIIGRSQGTLFYSAPDPGKGARLSIFSRSRGTVDFLDTRSVGGIDWGPCIPLSERRARCSTRGVRRIRVEVYDGDDFVRSTAAVALSVSGGSGDDVIQGGYGDDELDGGSGADNISGGLGADRADGSEGDDLLRLREGEADTVRCEGGDDRAVVDDRDIAGLALFLDCESRSTAAAAPDTRPPRVFLRAASPQELGRPGLSVAVAQNEPGSITARARLFFDGRRGPLLQSATARPDAPRQRWTLRLRADTRTRARVRAALARGTPVGARIWAVGRDAAGNRGLETTRARLAR